MNLQKHCPWLAICLVAVAGCQSAEVPKAAVTPTSAPPAPQATAPTAAPPAAATPRTPDLANPKVAAAPAPEFKPPFPERLDMFEAPKRAQGTVRRDEELGQSVELKGFVNVDEPRVILSIDGNLSPVPEGGETYGVQVISIQPPKVVLQRGRSRWTATLD